MQRPGPELNLSYRPYPELVYYAFHLAERKEPHIHISGSFSTGNCHIPVPSHFTVLGHSDVITPSSGVQYYLVVCYRYQKKVIRASLLDIDGTDGGHLVLLGISPSWHRF